MSNYPELIPIGTKTKIGKVSAVANIGGERYYFMIDKFGTVSMMPQISMTFLLQSCK